MEIHFYTAPSGVRVETTVPPVEEKWWDRLPAHLIWSYASWVSMILVQYNRPGLRAFLAKRGWWGMPKPKVKR